MKYPVYIVKNENTTLFKLSALDLPSCEVDARTVDDGINLLTVAIETHLKILAEYGEKIPNAKSIDWHMRDNESGIWAVVDIDIVPYLGKSQKINVTLPELLIKQIDDRVSKSPEHKTRSGFIAAVCVNELSRD